MLVKNFEYHPWWETPNTLSSKVSPGKNVLTLMHANRKSRPRFTSAQTCMTDFSQICSFQWFFTLGLSMQGQFTGGVFMRIFNSISCVSFCFIFQLNTTEKNKRINHNTLYFFCTFFLPEEMIGLHTEFHRDRERGLWGRQTASIFIIVPMKEMELERGFLWPVLESSNVGKFPGSRSAR